LGGDPDDTGRRGMGEGGKMSLEININVQQKFYPILLVVSAEVRYWEDADVNGVEDNDGTLIPFRVGEKWCPVVSLITGHILDWPKGTTAKIHYKVCDQGEYWLQDAHGNKAKWRGCYVPDSLLCVGDDGYGDYIILNVSADGVIEGWKTPRLDGSEWEMVPQ